MSDSLREALERIDIEVGRGVRQLDALIDEIEHRTLTGKLQNRFDAIKKEVAALRASTDAAPVARAGLPVLLEPTVELATRNIMREQTDFIGRMHQAMGGYEVACEEWADGEGDDAGRDDAAENLTELIGLALAQLAMVCNPTDPLAALSHPPATDTAQAEPIPTDSLRAMIGELGNQIHNLGCEHQGDEKLASRLEELRTEAWRLAGLASITAQAEPVGLREIVERFCDWVARADDETDDCDYLNGNHPDQMIDERDGWDDLRDIRDSALAVLSTPPARTDEGEG